ncbi:hypothetical protein [Kribbella speibonae]|uniref:DUF3987 domain-containing protein n=1 Tax=Kribbella speibonae TaxID=1572660 RepID=A0ABY2AAQ7_9ACTN|nr:hypothetical protein [Kribbella speibonae]TCC26730.1 hypothetical protein E0H58_01495 [Kribbella speibonae]
MGFGREYPDQDVPPPYEESSTEQLWDRDEKLAYIHDFARSRRVSPWSLLGALMVRSACTIPPTVTVPAIIGTRASLNLYVALTGPSGTGKGASEGAAQDLFPSSVHKFTPGSGEGIAHVYRERVVEDKIQVLRTIRDTALCSIPEVDLLTTLGGRQGSTLMPVLRQGWSGEQLGNQNASKERTVPVEAHTYRLGVTLGVQPGRAGALLEDADGGTPQRFLWLPTLDPDAPEHPPVLEDYEPLKVNYAPWRHGDIALPDVIWHTVQEAQWRKLRGEVDTLDGHRLLTYIKATVALTVLCGRRLVTEYDWDTAGLLMRKSDDTRAWVQQVLAEENTRRRNNEAVADGLHEVIKNDVIEAKNRERLTRWVKRTLRKEGELASNVLRKKAAGRDRDTLHSLLDDLASDGSIGARTDVYNGQEATFYSAP